MKLIRFVLGFFVTALDQMTAPTPIEREVMAQKALDAKTAVFTLYHLQTCPFCVKVRREIQRLNLKIAMKEIALDPVAGAELIAGGKIDQAPCLRIDSAGETQWMYESSAINAYLRSLAEKREEFDVQ